MARNQYDDDDDFTLDETNDVREDSRLVRDLRKQLKDAQKERDTLAQQVTDLAKNDRARNLSEVIKSKGLNPKVAKFYPSDAEATPEAVDAWISENGDVFGVQAPAVEEQTDEADTDATDLGFDPTTQAAYRRLQMTEGSVQIPGNKAAELHASIRDAKSPEELTAALRAGTR